MATAGLTQILRRGRGGRSTLRPYQTGLSFQSYRSSASQASKLEQFAAPSWPRRAKKAEHFLPSVRLIVQMPPAWLLLLLLACAAVAQAGRVTGTVVDGAGEPVEGAYVQAKAGEPPEVVAQAQSNGNGHYVFDAPAGLMTLAVTARGYYVISSGGLDSDTITQSCPAEGPCGEVDFRLGRPGVVEGWLYDRFGDPVCEVMLGLRLADDPAPFRPGFPGTRGSTSGWAISDDRGYFRIWNLRPGRYVLRSESQNRPFGGAYPTFALPPQQVEIAEQAETVELRLAVDSDQTLHTISGIIEGIEIAKDSNATIVIQPKSTDRWRQFWSPHRVRGEQFSISDLQTGDYVLRLAGGEKGQSSRGYQLLGEIHVDRDITDLRLVPSSGAGVRLKVNFSDMEQRNVDLHLTPVDPGTFEHFNVKGPAYEIVRAGLTPGLYELGTFSKDYYLAERYRVTLQNGQIVPLTVVIGNAFASLRGKVRVAAGAQRAGAAHFTVGARGPHGSYKKQADEAGHFEFEKLPPGSYRLAAWRKPDINVEDDRAWNEASGVASIELDPGFDVEVDITATP